MTSQNLAVTIDRTKWCRGQGSDYSRLLIEYSKKMCCIGFVAKASGVREDEMLNKRAVKMLSLPAQDKMPNVDYAQAYHINDAQYFSEDERERNLTQWGIDHGIDFTFIN